MPRNFKYALQIACELPDDLDEALAVLDIVRSIVLWIRERGEGQAVRLVTLREVARE